MDAHMLADDFAFANNGMRGPWLANSGDDISLVPPSADDFTRTDRDWNEFLQWDPAAAQSAPTRTINAQGPLCYLKPDLRPPLFNRQIGRASCRERVF